jgi:hypothetical protein
MAYKGQTFRLPFDLAGFQFNRNADKFTPTALVDGTRNVNFHEGGIGKRGGTSRLFSTAIAGLPTIHSLFDFRKLNQTQFLVFGTNQGKLYHTNESNVLKTGMSTSNPFSFAVMNDELYIADGGTAPKYWNGSNPTTTDVLTATSWAGASGFPFQVLFHSRGANARMWAVTRDSVWASKNNDGHDFSDAQVKQIRVYSEGGLVGAFDFNGTLFAFSKTETFIIDDTSSDTNNWGYQKAIWEGGAATWRLMAKAGNNLYVMTEEGLIYTLKGIQATGDYELVAVNKPAFIDRYIRDQVSVSNMLNFHCTFDRTRRCIEYFMQSGGSANNLCLAFFIDRPPEIAWIIHDNNGGDSAFKAAGSTEVRVSTGQYRVYTGDYAGQIWKTEQTSRDDGGSPYDSGIKTRALDMGNPRMWKHFGQGRLKTRAQGNYDLTVRVWIDGVRKDDIPLALVGSGATFDNGFFDSSVFADDQVIPVQFDVNDYGYDCQFEVLNNETGEDFFLSELLLDFMELGGRMT